MRTHIADFTKKRILVIDDDHDTVDSTVTILNYMGFLAGPSYDAEMARKMVGIAPSDVVLLDIAMPGTGGYELARELRQLAGMADALFICITGLQGENVRRKALDAGCNHLLLKPVDWTKLLELLGWRNDKS